jgi:hypothetical protein
MNFENTYLTKRRDKEQQAGKLLDRITPSAPRRDALETAYEMMDAAIFHILRPADTQTRNQLVRSAFEALLLNRDIDHVPAFAGRLCDYLDVVDEGHVLDLAAQGQQFLFAGFHTGPYWSVFQTLVRNRLNVATLFPGALEAKRQEIGDVFAAATAHYGSTSTLDLISLEDPNFLLRLRSSMGDGKQLVVFLDGNSGLPAQKNEKRDVAVDFFHAKITVKTTIPRLADILGLPVVTFNAVRNDIRRTLWLDAPLPKREKKQYDEVIRVVFDRLRARLEQEPAQWEGWLYFHTYFSPPYRASLDGGAGTPLEKRERFFMQEINGHTLLVDKQTYKQYRVKKREGAHA